jgi:hypothetical protein
MIDVLSSPSASRLLLLFRKTDSHVVKFHIAGAEYEIQPQPGWLAQSERRVEKPVAQNKPELKSIVHARFGKATLCVFVGETDINRIRVNRRAALCASPGVAHQ